MTETDRRLPTKEEESALLEVVAEAFLLDEGLKPIVIHPEDITPYAELLLETDSDAFGGRLENAEIWLQENFGEETD